MRIVSTASGNHALQVVSKRAGKLTVHKHIGTFRTDEEKAQLIQKAEVFIRERTGQMSLLEQTASFRPADIAVSENRPLFVYHLLAAIYDKLGFNSFPDALIKDLVIARIYAPSSKRETQDILADLFNRHYALITIYRHLKKGLEKNLKETFQNALIQFAKDGLHDTLKLVFYDVTTLYFESIKKDTLRNFGFSKEHRAQEVQIVVGLVVNSQGFPLYYDIFSGKTFEGHTFLPVIETMQKLLGTKEVIVIADSAMISQDNIDKLIAKNIGFIVGARVANLPTNLIDTISTQLNGHDKKTLSLTYRDQRLVCQYSEKRAAKDRSDRTKQVEKVKKALANPATVASRYRFMKTDGKAYTLNTALITKAEKLEGIKGYVTNTTLSEQTIIDRYHDLWRIENAFRFTKTDLEARPVFHRLEETIKAHMVIVFAGLAMSRYIEIQTGMSMQKVLKIAGKVLTHKVTNTKTGESAYVETTIEDQQVNEKIALLRALGH